MSAYASPHPTEPSTASRPMSLAAGATVAAVAAVCIGYAAWTLRQGASNEPESIADGVALQVPTVHDPGPLRALNEPIPQARLTLDESANLNVLPVINAHLEVPLDRNESVIDEPAGPAVRQLGFVPQVASERPIDAVGAWLTGTIEPLPPDSPAATSR